MIAKISSRLGFESFDDETFEFYCGFLRVAFVLLAWTSQADLLSPYNVETLSQLSVGFLFLLTSFLTAIGFGGGISALMLAVSLMLSRQWLGFYDARPDLTYHHTTALATVFAILAFSPSFNRISFFPRKAKGLLSSLDILFLLRLLTVVIYFFAACHKLSAALAGTQNMMSFFVTIYTGSLGAIRPEHQSLFYSLTVLNAFFELGIAAALLIPRTRKAAIVIGVAFHLALYLALPVHVFSLLMIALLTSFLDRESLAALVARLRGA